MTSHISKSLLCTSKPSREAVQPKNKIHLYKSSGQLKKVTIADGMVMEPTETLYLARKALGHYVCSSNILCNIEI